MTLDNGSEVRRTCTQTQCSAAPLWSHPLHSLTTSTCLAAPCQVEMDASAYMDQLKAEAQALRLELAKFDEAKQKQEAVMSTSISAYVSSLPEKQLKVLTSGISEDVVGAMRQLVEYILRAPSGDGGPLGKDQSVTMEQAKLQTLCLYQLVLGYRLREAEATGEATDAIGQ